jgi:hypothetical protein
MVQNFVEARGTNPMKLVDWGAVDESQSIVCPCCGWSARLGECAQAPVEGARAYGCRQCAMVLVARVFPSVIQATFLTARRARSHKRWIANY